MKPRMLALLFMLACALWPRPASAQVNPAFSDANWATPDVFPGVNGQVYAMAVDEAGNLYIGGYFTAVGGVPATNVAKWNGSSWSALGSGIPGYAGRVWALAVSGTNLYAVVCGGLVAKWRRPQMGWHNLEHSGGNLAWGVGFSHK